MSKRFIITLALIFIILFGVFAATYTPVVDTKSTYTPTQIVNGSFDTYPWMNYTYNGIRYTSWSDKTINPANNVELIEFHGVGEGWNTTEKRPWNGNLFEFVSSDTNWYNHNNSLMNKTKHYVEMNCTSAAILYQDLYTVGGDVIRWTLNHGIVNITGNEDRYQSMRVEIGAPQRDNSGNIYNATGTGTSLNWNDNTKLIKDTVAIFRSTGVTNTSGNESTIGFGNSSELSYLLLDKNTQATKWWESAGVYVVPEGQTVSRFAFISEAPNPTYGNLLDDITFSTLIGNLSAVLNTDKSLKISGYWGDSDANKKLYIQFNTESQPTEVDMTGVLNKNFTITIPNIPANATSVDIYHQDYKSAKKTVEIVAGYLFYKGTTNEEYTSGTSNPAKHLLKDPTFTLNNPSKPEHEFVGWSGTGISGLSKNVIIEKESIGDRTFTANWHKHKWVFEANGPALVAYCIANNLNSNLCSYHGIEHAVSLSMQAQWNAGLAATVLPSNATNKNVIWSSSDSSILTVDKKGLIHGLAAGEATVTATAADESNKSASCTVTISESYN